LSSFVKLNLGRVGAIKLEQLETLLLSLKNNWSYGNSKDWSKYAETTSLLQPIEEHSAVYEL
jgi:hypothetical protein